MKNSEHFQNTKIDLIKDHPPALTIHGKIKFKKHIGIALRILVIAAVIAIVAFIIYIAYEAHEFKRKKLCDEMVEQVIFKINEKVRLAEKEAAYKLLDKSDTNDKNRTLLDYKPQSRTIQDLSSARNSIQECK